MFGRNLGLIWTVFRPLFSRFLYGGTLITGIGVAVAVCQAAALTLGAFACSSLWMVVDSRRRPVQARRAGEEAQRKDVQ